MNKIICLIVLLACNSMLFAQKTIQEFVAKTGTEKIKKGILMDAFTVPATHKSFKDGHGKNPYFSSTEQLPDTIALITFHINDLGFTDSWSNDFYIYYKSYAVSKSEGNEIANDIQMQTLEGLKEEFKKRGAVLLIPSEFLDTPEKIAFYNDEFIPQVSKAGKFLSNFENRKKDISVCASDYRYFDMGASFDYKRSISLGGELADKLGVDAVLSIGVLIQTFKKETFTKSVKMSLHGPNPNPKLDKKYVGQKTGTGYYDGQLYAGGTYIFKNPIRTILFRKDEITSINFEGMDVIFNSFIERLYDEMNGAIEKVSK